jgi:hypothetical protein
MGGFVDLLLICLGFSVRLSPLSSDHTSVQLIQGNRQEFYVRFKGPEESAYFQIYRCETRLMAHSTIPRRIVEGSR